MWLLDIPEQDKFSVNEEQRIVDTNTNQQNISFINKENINKTPNKLKRDRKSSKENISFLKFIDNDISNFITNKSNIEEQEKLIIERKQCIKRRKLNLSTIDYTTEKFIDIKKCNNNYRKIRLKKNKYYSKGTKIIGFINNNIELNKNIFIENENIDKYDKFWIIKENRHLIIGSWRR